MKRSRISVVQATSNRLLARKSALAIAAGVLTGLFVVPLPASASSHRDAPLIAEDPAADNTDVYAFVSTEPGRAGFVTVIANYIPLQEPANGPNFHRLSDNVTYEINIDTDGDGKADLTYRFDFTTRIVNDLTFFYNTGVIGAPTNPADPSSHYVNLNQRQRYTLREFGRGLPKDGRVLLENVRTAPTRVGPKSLLPHPAALPAVQGDTSVVYQNLAQLAVHTAANSNGLRAFVGSRDEGFHVDLGSAFDLINLRVAPPGGVDQTSGYNVSTLAVEIPFARLRAAGDTDGIIGVWATASRRSLPFCNTGGPENPSACAPLEDGTYSRVVPVKGPQVSRLANPLFNEALNPLRVKDLYNAIEPTADERNSLQFILNPGTSQSPDAIVPRLRALILCTDVTNRRDQVASWMQGYPAGVVYPGGVVPPIPIPALAFPGNRETQTQRPVVADMIRLNYNIPPAIIQNPLGVLAGDYAGMPNGRRVGDNTVDILLKLWGGTLQAAFGGNACPLAAALTDNMPLNDAAYLSAFPYLGLPHEGFTHTHTHNIP